MTDIPIQYRPVIQIGPDMPRKHVLFYSNSCPDCRHYLTTTLVRFLQDTTPAQQARLALNLVQIAIRTRGGSSDVQVAEQLSYGPQGYHRLGLAMFEMANRYRATFRSVEDVARVARQIGLAKVPGFDAAAALQVVQGLTNAAIELGVRDTPTLLTADRRLLHAPGLDTLRGALLA